MKILIYDINYAPELTGVGKYTGDMGAWLVKQGHSVDVITAMPYYPEWQVHDTYKGKLWFTETIEGAVVHRCPCYVPEKVTTLKRILHEFSFILSSLVYWIPVFFKHRYDIVICIAPPFHIGFIPLMYCKVRKTSLWLHLQDLQVDMAKELNMLTNQYFLNFLFRLERFILKQATIVSTISEGMVQKTNEKNVTRHPCVLFPNWVDETYVRPLPREESLRAELALSDTDKVVIYSGNLGEKQGLELIIEAAHHFSDQSSIKFIICGSGGGKARLKALAENYGLTNVLFLPLQPYERLSALLASGDVHLVLQRKSASDLVLPSKLTGILAAGGCALVTALPNTTLHNLIASHQMGIIVEPESAYALINGIKQALQTDITSFRQNARTYAKWQLSKEVILHKFQHKLLQVSNGSYSLPESGAEKEYATA